MKFAQSTKKYTCDDHRHKTDRRDEDEQEEDNK